MKRIVLTFCLLTITGCSSTPTVNGIKYEKDETLSTLGDKSMPDWAEQGETQPFMVKGGKVYSVGVTTIRGDERPEAALRMAEANSRANVARHIETRMEYIFQGAEENFGFDSTQAKYIAAEVSNITGRAWSVEGHWYKRYSQVQEDGSKRIFYKAYALTALPESELRRAIFQAAHKGEGEHKLSAGFEKQVNAQWDRIVTGEQAPVSEKQRKLSSETTENEAQ